jgi:tripartite-type tricarboxylate transporter receptor subunit TctC
MRVTGLVSAVLMMSLATFAHGQGWPSKPVRIVVNGAPGSTADLIARGFNQRLGSSLGQPVIVDNRVGGGGSTGIGVVAKSAPDGYTLLHSPGSLFVFGSHVPGLDFDITTDIEPIATTARNTILLTARPGLNVSTVGELVALARANPGKLNYGSGSLGLHVATEMMLRAAKARATYVPYKSPPQALNDLMGGQIDFVLDPGIAIPHAKAGKVRLLGAASSVRSQALPDLPTLAEAGVDMDAGMITVIALYGPARLPKDMVARLNAEVGRIMQTPEARAVVSGLGSEVLTSSPSEMAALLRRDRERYGTVIREANIRIE